MGADQAVGFLDRLSEQSPVLALLGLIILALIGAVCWIVRHFVGRMEDIAKGFRDVMAKASERNYEISEKRLASANEAIAVQSRLATLIEGLSIRRQA